MSKRISLLIAIAGLSALIAASLTGAKPSDKPKVSYAADIAPILNTHCVDCHRPGQVAPFSLIGYDNAKKWAPMIAAVTEAKRMPPWKAVHGFGEFLDENRLTTTEIERIANWERAGMPRGDKSLEPKPKTYPSEWAVGTPDMIAQATKPFKLEAEGDDVYRNFVIPTNFKETKWVTGIDVRPGNPKIVHHVIAFLDEKGRALKKEESTKDGQEGYGSWGGGVGFDPDGSFGGWAPGVRAKKSNGETAFELKPGTTIVMQVHYHKSGKPEEDLTKLGLYFAKEKPKQVLKLAWLANPLFRLKAGEKDQKVVLNMELPADVTPHGVMPHMHMLGRSMKATATLPDGKLVPLIHIDDWDFNWQLTYAYKQPIRLPKGTKLHIEAVYDNSPENPRNPHSPPKQITWGEQTTDEMMLFVAAYSTDDNKGFDDRAALIKALFGKGGG